MTNCCAAISYSKCIQYFIHTYRYCAAVQWDCIVQKCSLTVLYNSTVRLYCTAVQLDSFSHRCHGYPTPILVFLYFCGHVWRHLQINAFYQHLQGHIRGTPKTIQNLLNCWKTKFRIPDISTYSKKVKVKLSHFMPWRHLWGLEV